MLEFLRRLFDTQDFPARWHCGNWTAVHGWIHISSDLAVAGAYAAIPMSIASFVSRRRDVTFPKLYWLFAAFILSCGLGHLLEATIFWRPWYRFSAAVKLLTATVSWGTVIALYRYMPTALALPGTVRLNEQLTQQIAERTRAENEVRQLNVRLRQRIEELETLLDVLPVGIGIANDPQCQNIRTNEAFSQILRLSRSSNASLSAPLDEAPAHFRVRAGGRELTPSELPIQAAAAHQTTIRGFEEEVVFGDGDSVHLLASAAPLFDESGVVRGAVGAFVDITSLKQAQDLRVRMERKLQEAQKLESLGILAGGIAHDFNNLLTGVMGNASLARLELSPSSAVASYLEQIEQAALRAADLCRQMLAYAGRGRFMVEPLDMSALVLDTTHLLQTSISKKATLKFDLPSGLPSVEADASQIRQIVMNLVINASEAMAESGGIITLGTGVLRADRSYLDTTIMAPDLQVGDYVFVEVSDTGCGMAPETLSKIFDPFFTTKFTGRGLGLAAVLGIVRSHGGAIKVYSEPGRGTTFKIILPCADAGGAPAIEQPAATLTWKGSGVALVVDDEAAVRNVASRMLGKLGFRVLTADNGEEGIALLREHKDEISVVLLDLTMPRLDGEQTFRELRLVMPGVRVVLMSGFNEQEAIHRFSGKGLSGFLPKPFILAELTDRVRRVLS